MPSKILREADTFDLYVLNIAAKNAKRQRDIQEGKVVDTPKLTKKQEAEYLARMKARRNKKK